MFCKHVFVSAVALAAGAACADAPAFAAAADYRFELVGKPRLSGQTDIVDVRLIHVTDSKPVIGAVIFESTADMGPQGMPSMPAPVQPLPPKGDNYSFAISPAMAGTWALHLVAKVQGEVETVRGTLNADLVK